jgi:hypothetical protein
MWILITLEDVGIDYSTSCTASYVDLFINSHWVFFATNIEHYIL